jgi:hypothetical protein
MLHILMDACRNGREIASEHGVWREVLAPGGMRLALAYLAGAANPSSPSKKSAAAQTAMATHFGIFMSHAKTGGCDLYLLWSAEGTPTALAAVAADGTHVSVSVPTGAATFDRETAVGMLAETVGVASPPPGSLSRSRGGGV